MIELYMALQVATAAPCSLNLKSYVMTAYLFKYFVRGIVLLFLLFFSTVLFAQKDYGHVSILGGGYVHEAIPTVNLLGPGYDYLVVSPFLGFSYQFPGSDFSFSYRRSLNYGHTANKDIRFGVLNFRGTDSSMDEIGRLDLFYRIGNEKLANMRLGLGYFRKRWVTTSYFLAQEAGVGFAASNFSGLSFSVAFDFKEVSVELSKLLEIEHGFDIFSSYLYGVSVYRSFPLHLKGRKGRREAEEKKTENPVWDHFFPFISLHLRPVKYYHTVNDDLFNPVGIVPGLGIGYYFPKYDASLIVSRDVWKRLIGGTHSNDVIGYISTTNIMLKKYFEGKRNGKWVVGLGWHPIRNDNEPWRQLQREMEGHLIQFPRYTNVFGIGYSIGYALDEHYELELRQIIPYFGDKAFTPWYSGIGVVYNFREEGF